MYNLSILTKEVFKAVEQTRVKCIGPIQLDKVEIADTAEREKQQNLIRVFYGIKKTRL